jgi:putative endonuclease
VSSGDRLKISKLGDRLPAQAGLKVFKMWFVYILKSSKAKWYYVGSTNRLEKRLSEHNSGKVVSTSRFCPLALVYTKSFAQEKEARAYEKLVKEKRIEKESIIRDIEK